MGSKGYRPPSSYVSHDPDKRARQLANLKHGRKPGKPVSSRLESKRTLQNSDIITFATEYLGLSFGKRPAQAVILKAIYGLELTQGEVALYDKLTGGLNLQHEKGSEAIEIVLALGARGGKSTLAAIMALYEAIVKGHIWRKHLAPKEYGYAVIVATRQRQAEDIIQHNCARLLTNSPRLKDYLAAEPLKAELELSNGLKIISLPCNSTAGRGLPIFFLAFDEIGHFFTEGARADTDIYNSLSPRLAQFPGAKTVLGSTPAAKQGLLWQWFNEGFTVARRATFQAATALMNPLVDKDFLERQRARDPDNYAREFLAQFAEKVSAFFDYDLLTGCLQLASDVQPKGGLKYFCGLDQSGLAGRDRFGLGISHQERDGKVIVDAVRAWETTIIDKILGEIEALAKAYGFTRLLIDRYAAGWVAQALEKIGLKTDVRPNLSEVYANAKGLMTAGRLVLPDNPELKGGLVNTQAFFGRNNSLSIQHERVGSGHADMADAVLSAVWNASQHRPSGTYSRLSRDQFSEMW